MLRCLQYCVTLTASIARQIRDPLEHVQHASIFKAARDLIITSRGKLLILNAEQAILHLILVRAGLRFMVSALHP